MGDEEKLCKVPGCKGRASDDREGYCHGHWSERVQYIRQTVEKAKQDLETPWEQMKRNLR